MSRMIFATIAVGLIAVGELAAQSTQPTTLPTTRPLNTWTSDAYGRLILRPFATAPFPHVSRARGYTNAAGVTFGPEHYQDSTVGIFVPKNFRPDGQVNLVFYFHGHRNHVSRVIDDFKLEAQLVKSNLNAILVVPQGPLDVPDSGGGKLELDEGGFARFAADVAGYLKREGITPTDRIGAIALAAHSGGYNVTASILQRGGMNDRISDVILLDATYGGLEVFYDFILHKPSARIVSFHTRHLDGMNRELSDDLDWTSVTHREVAETDVTKQSLGQPGVTFVSTTLAHNDVPSAKDYLALSLAGCHFSAPEKP